MIEDWPKIPEIPVFFKPYDGGFKAMVNVDLGALGVHNLDIQIDEAEVKKLESEDPEFLKEMMEEGTAEIQHAFRKLIYKFAAVALVEEGGGYAPLVNYYEMALEDMTAVPV